jgi:alkylation response protein AidB-like acyl-CoA dehydrogenase
VTTAAPDLRDVVRSWVAEAWHPELTVREWWARLADAGWSQPTWPLGLGGRGLRPADARIVTEELAAAGLIGPPTGGIAVNLAAPTLLTHGSDAQIKQHLPRIADGTESWCQLFSEPGAGSDLASLGTRATRTDGGWRVSGQKVWSSTADLAQRALLLGRTNVDVAKHEGITYFTLDMDQPGVDVRPLRQMNGASSFCEVFLDDVLVTEGDVIGEVDHGWKVAQTTLLSERQTVAARAARGLVMLPSGPLAGHLDRTVGDVLAARAERDEVFGYALPWKTMLQLARDHGRDADPVVRQALVRYHTANRLTRLTGQRFQQQRSTSGAEGSVLKMYVADICQMSRDLVFSIIGAETMLGGADAPMGGQIHSSALGSFGSRIGGGTDEVQKNLIGERGLGLPREPSIDRGVPYRELRVGTQRSDSP